MKSNSSIFKSFHLLIFTLLLLQFAIFNLQCEKPTPPDDKPHYIPSISLTAEDVGVTEAFIKVKFIDTTVSRVFKLARDGKIILTTQSLPSILLLWMTTYIPTIFIVTKL